jgi:hypothetical protein
MYSRRRGRIITSAKNDDDDNDDDENNMISLSREYSSEMKRVMIQELANRRVDVHTMRPEIAAMERRASWLGWDLFNGSCTLVARKTVF